MLKILYLLSFLFLAHYFFSDRRKFFKILSCLMFSYFVSENLKMIFGLEREGFFSPFSYPSSHATVFTSLALSLGGLARIFYTPIYLLILYLRIYYGAHDFLEILGGVFTGMFSWSLYTILRDRLGVEFDRKCFHVGLGTWIIILCWKDYFLTVELLAILSAVGFPLVYRTPPILKDFVEYYGKGNYKGLSALLFILGILSSAIFGMDAMVFGVQNLVWVDFLSFLLGRIFGAKRKSLIGMVGSYFGLFAAILTLRLEFHPIYLLIPILEFSFELDNLSIPFGSSFLYFLVNKKCF